MPAIGSARITPGIGAISFNSSTPTANSAAATNSANGPTGPTGPIGPGGAAGATGATGPVGAPGAAGTLSVNQLGAISATTLSLDVTTNRVNTLTLNTSLTSLSLTFDTSGTYFAVVLFVVTQGASGGPFTITWPDTFSWQGGYAPSLSTAPGAMDVIQLMTFNSGQTWLASIAIQVPAP